ncbi:MAG: SDR family oxidoreductase [Alphaproteobacteria bacterium]|nr:SDR family oxidoreductase [Alphaproteobacteria bacterium]
MSARKSIFVTGAGSGIGRATAQFFAAKGWFAGLYDINASGLDETAKDLPLGQFCKGVFDVRDRAGWAQAMNAFAEQSGNRLDVLFNNAGIGKYGWFEDITPEDSDAVIDINLKGVVNGVYAGLPLLRKTPNARIINTASAAGVFGSPQLAVYSATKFAVRGLTEALDVEFSRYGVRVVSLMPWFLETAILDMGGSAGANRNLRDQIHDTHAEVYPVSLAAQRAWDAAHGEDVHYMVGKEAERARFAARFFPNGLRNRMKKQIGAAQ